MRFSVSYPKIPGTSAPVSVPSHRRQQVAYWVLEKDAHTPSFKANLRHITQVAMELDKKDGELFFRVIKSEGRLYGRTRW
ncbi:MAG: hypothetical protein ABIN58_04495 [candidate division WOR-3 bacterium]